MKNRLIFLLPAVILLAASCNAPRPATPVDQNKIQAPSPSATPTPQQSDAGKIKTYTDSSFGFEFQYPADYTLKEGAAAEGKSDYYIPVQSYLIKPGTMLVTAEMPRDSYPKTDFAGGFFNVSVNKGMSELECGQYPSENDELMTLPEIKSANGITFYKGTSGGAAAGNQSSDTFFNTYHAGTCFELSLGVRTSGYGAVDGIKQVDEKAVFQQLETIFNSFKFIK